MRKSFAFFTHAHKRRCMNLQFSEGSCYWISLLHRPNGFTVLSSYLCHIREKGLPSAQLSSTLTGPRARFYVPLRGIFCIPVSLLASYRAKVARRAKAAWYSSPRPRSSRRKRGKQSFLFLEPSNRRGSSESDGGGLGHCLPGTAGRHQWQAVAGLGLGETAEEGTLLAYR